MAVPRFRQEQWRRADGGGVAAYDENGKLQVEMLEPRRGTRQAGAARSAGRLQAARGAPHGPRRAPEVGLRPDPGHRRRRLDRPRRGLRDLRGHDQRQRSAPRPQGRDLPGAQAGPRRHRQHGRGQRTARLRPRPDRRLAASGAAAWTPRPTTTSVRAARSRATRRSARRRPATRPARSGPAQEAAAMRITTAIVDAPGQRP